MTDSGREELGRRIEDALRLVNPSSAVTLSISDWSYVIGVNDGGGARILMTTTTRGCPASSFLKDGARQAAVGVPGVTSADVTLTYDPAWTPDMMKASAREQLGFGPDNDP